MQIVRGFPVSAAEYVAADYHKQVVPRESDMARVIYERFFLYAKKLEESLGDKNAASFQYIITTTTPPPKEMQRGSPWLLEPVLDGAKKDGKLLTEAF